MYVDQAKKVLVPEDNNLFIFKLEDFTHGQKVTVTIEPFVRERTLGQNALFYKYIKMICDDTENDKEQVKLEMKKRYGARNEQGHLKSTRDYTTVEMKKLIEATRLFGIEELGLNMPLPEELKNNNIK